MADTSADSVAYAVRVWWSPSDSFVRPCASAAEQRDVAEAFVAAGAVKINIKGWRPVLRVALETTVSTPVFPAVAVVTPDRTL